MSVSLERKEVIRALVDKHGVDVAAKLSGITRETVRRYTRKRSDVDARVSNKDVAAQSPTLAKIAERYTDKELRLLAEGNLDMGYKHTPVHDFTGKTVKIGYMSDTHVGSIYLDDSYISDAREEFAKEGVDMVVHAGDVTEGMSNRAGHIYECSELGFDAQKEKTIDLFEKFDFCPLYMIDGNHDRWFLKSNGARVVKDICGELSSAKFLGHDEGDIELGENASLKLWHGEDRSSYAISYRLQKLIESLSGGDKPNILIAGHVHKYGKFFIRNVHCIGAGCVQKQSKWMRGKRIDAHTGFGIIDAMVNETGIAKITETFYPYYA